MGGNTAHGVVKSLVRVFTPWAKYEDGPLVLPFTLLSGLQYATQEPASRQESIIALEAHLAAEQERRVSESSSHADASG